MEQQKRTHLIRYLLKSKFVRSVFLRVVSIFLILMIAIIAVVFLSFTSEIQKSIISERQKQLEIIQDSISKRMDEVSSISYHVGQDKTFYMTALPDDQYASRDMSSKLESYLVGNDFIEHLAFYRLSEPDTLYVSSGEISFHDFWVSYLRLSREASDEVIQKIQENTEPMVYCADYGGESQKYCSYVCPLPQFSKSPQAFVLMLIPFSEVEKVLSTQLINCSGQITVFDGAGRELFGSSTLDEPLPIDLTDERAEQYLTIDGKQYIQQRVTSPSNGWVYVSTIRLNDMISGVATRQVLFLVLLLVIMLIGILAMLMGIITQYKPISRLAMRVSDAKDAHDAGSIIDEQSLLVNTFATLRDSSDQKEHFEEAYHAEAAANKAKSAFLSNMSHDIRTPMNAIMGMNEIAMTHADDPKLVRDCLQKVRVASGYLLDIINNVLDMSRIESGKLTLNEETVELPKLIYGLITILNQSISAKHQQLIVSTDNVRSEMVIGDGVRLTQVFVNILSNAVKFTPEGGIIRFSVREEEGTTAGCGNFVFVFADTGIGMSPEFQARVFDTFTRDENVTVSKIEGTGLGMAIAKSFVELMGGTISCESVPGEGTTFTVRLPLRIADAFPQDADGGIYGKYRDVPLLIYGENAEICENQLALFTALGARADWSSTLAEACARLNQARADKHPYQLLLIHPGADDPSGIEATRCLSQAAGTENVSLLLAAVDLFAVEQLAAQEAGVATFLQMPLFRSAAIRILNKQFEPPDKKALSTVPDLRGLRVLLAEDNELNRQIARMLLTEANAVVTEALNGEEAVNAFLAQPEHSFDVILMDVRMPVMDGFAAAHAIRTSGRADADIPIFAMTANTLEEDVIAEHEAGMNGHLGKPYDAMMLYRLLTGVTPPSGVAQKL